MTGTNLLFLRGDFKREKRKQKQKMNKLKTQNTKLKPCSIYYLFFHFYIKFQSEWEETVLTKSSFHSSLKAHNRMQNGL